MRNHEDMEPGAGGRSMGAQVKMWGAGALVVYFVLLVVLNSDPVEINLLFTTLDMSLSIVLLLCGAIGFGVGWLLGRMAGRRRRKDRRN